MDFSEQTEADMVVFKLSGKIISCSEAYPLMSKMKDHIGQKKRKFVIDLSEVPWMNSQGIALLVWAMTTIKNVDGKLALSGISQQNEKMLKITGLYALFAVYPNIDEAVISI